MNSVELKQYIYDRNGKLNGTEAKFVTDIKIHPQLDHIVYNPWNKSYDMWDVNGNFYHFEMG